VTADVKWIVDAWAEELKGVLQFLTAEEWTASVSIALSSSVPVGYFWWTQKFNVDPGAQITVGAPALAWSELGARVLQAAGVDLIEQATARSTYLESVQQSMSGLARVFSERAARIVDASGGSEAGPSNSASHMEVVLNTGGLDLPALRVVVSAELSAAFQEAAKAASPIAAPISQAPTAAASVPPLSPPPPNASVLLDVQMPVSICFGRASMPLRDVMKLTSGSAVELDRRPDDEVDVIVNNCVIARGDVVVIDGNYGVRVTAIISREQRLALRPGTR
jgi:flagellar motor switch protein FliN/FliY